MKLVRQISLQFQQGRSDKVYEVDLCEVGSGQYVVNFRYGRRGAALRDGSKTPAPVSLEKAQAAFEKLVQSKVDKGYVEAGAPGAAPARAAAPAAPRPATTDTGGRDGALLSSLTDAMAGRPSRPLARLLWRVGELRLQAAGPQVMHVLEHPPAQRSRQRGNDRELIRYCAAWAAGRCADEDALPTLSDLFFSPDEKRKPDGARPRSTSVSGPSQAPADGRAERSPLGRIAGEAFLALAPETARTEFLGRVEQELSPGVRSARTRGPDALREALEAVDDEPTRARDVELLYLFTASGDEAADAAARAVVLGWVRTAPLSPPAFLRLRHLFKAAEFREDGELFGLIAYRFEKTPANFRKGYWGGTWVGGTYFKDFGAELGRQDSTLAYSDSTRLYLRRRVWRTLRRMGKDGDAGRYVKMAVGVLLPFTDDDAQAVRHSSYYSWETDRSVDSVFDRYAGYWALNHVLYLNSSRYELKQSGRAFRCSPGYSPGAPAPNQREEAFAHLWDDEPRGLVHLLMEAECTPVLEFAVRAVRANTGFMHELPLELVCALLLRPPVIVARFAFELAKERYDASDPNGALLVAAAQCSFDEGRAEAQGWIRARPSVVTSDPDKLFGLLFSRFEDTRKLASELLAGASLSDDDARVLAGKVIAHMLSLPGEGEASTIAQDVGTALLAAFGRPLRTLALEVVGDLLAHPAEGVQLFGAQLLLGHERRPPSYPDHLLPLLLNAAFASIRGIGVRLFGELGDDVLIRRVALLSDLAVSELADVRGAVAPLIARLAKVDEHFAADLATLLVGHLLREEPFEGLHASVLTLLKESLREGLEQINEEIIWRLLQSKGSAPQELGGELLKTNVDPAQLTLRRIALLASHDILSVREATLEMYEKSIPRLKNEMADAVRILDAKWDDSRARAIELFRKHFDENDFTPQVLVSIADSTRDDIQHFGKELLSRYFKEDYGQEYLVKLSEHPATNLQLFATNYLERYAKGDTERIKELTPYFLTVLSQVNKGRVAKERVFSFLQGEAGTSEEARRAIAEILSRQSATIAIGDRERAVTGMVHMNDVDPDLDMALKVKPFEQRAGKQDRGSNGQSGGKRGV